MSKELCVIQANCQVDGLVKLLFQNKAFNQRFTLRRYTNFMHEAVPYEELSSCAVFIYQHLGSKWNEQSSDCLLKQVNPKAKVLKIPNLLFKGYWPFWTNQSPSEFGDFFLDKLIAMGLNKSEIMHIYLHGKLDRKYDLQAMFEESVAIEREKELGCLVQTVDLVLEKYKQQQIFYTINHPAPWLLALLGEALFKELDLPISASFYEEFPDPNPELQLPVHPQLAKIHDLKFAGEHTRYNVYGKMKTFAEYTSNYIDSQLLDFKPLTSYLQLV